MNLKFATEAESAKLLELRIENANYHASLIPDYPLKPNARDFFTKNIQESLENPDSRIALAVENEEIVAYAIGGISPPNPIFELGIQASINDVYVKLESQQNGYGKAVVTKLFDWFSEKKVDHINLGVYAKNIAGARFWEKMGFELFSSKMYLKL